MSNMSDVKSCGLAECDKEGTQRCGGCKETFYCSKECQKTHWKQHKYDCRKGFKFMKLPKEIRDKVSKSFLVLAVTNSRAQD